MAFEAKPIDIGGLPELVSLAEEVRASNEPRVLRRGGEDIAKIVPLRARVSRRRRAPKTADDYDAFLSSAGGWANVDINAFLKANCESRDLSTRPVVEL
ncbi:MAG TPA: hypothetical protein VIK11_07960 [Tepidiformaceae bacterium]